MRRTSREIHDELLVARGRRRELAAWDERLELRIAELSEKQ